MNDDRTEEDIEFNCNFSKTFMKEEKVLFHEHKEQKRMIQQLKSKNDQESNTARDLQMCHVKIKLLRLRLLIIQRHLAYEKDLQEFADSIIRCHLGN